MNLMVWAGSGEGKSVQRSLGLGLVLSECTYMWSLKQSFSIMIFLPVVEHAPTLTACLSLTNFKEPISQKDLWNFWFDKSLWKLSWVLHKIRTWNCELLCFISYYPSLVSNVRNVRLIWSNLWMIVWCQIMVLKYIWWHFVKEQLNN